MLERIRKRAPSFLVISSILLLTTTCALWFDALSAFENKTWDARLKAIADQGVDPRVKIIMVTQSDLDFWARERHMSWPWPREMYVPVMQFLEQADAKGVAFDLIFSEPSYYGPSDDESFGAGMRGA